MHCSNLNYMDIVVEKLKLTLRSQSQWWSTQLGLMPTVPRRNEMPGENQNQIPGGKIRIALTLVTLYFIVSLLHVCTGVITINYA